MNRFSEDLDFFLKQRDPNFSWAFYLDHILRDGAREGIHFTVIDKTKENATVKKAFLRTDSFGKVLLLDLPFERDARKLIKVKLKIDTNPPIGSRYETRYIAFPVMAAITTQSLASGFAMKLSALLGRKYTKGRDWYDFIWYISKRIVPDLDLIQNSLDQQGPWAGRKLRISPDWLEKSLKKRITETNWEIVRQDVQRFLPLREQESLRLWEREFFLHHLGIFAEYVVTS
jgi:hypothetical protein